MSLDPKQVHKFIIKPTLEQLGLGGLAAERLVLGTALTESGLQFISQVPSGIAKGIYQMEKATHDDIWDNFLKYKDVISSKVQDLFIHSFTGSNFEQLCGNLYYATAMCRIHYLRQKEPIPKEDDLTGMANYWKKYYNTPLGAGKPEDFINKAKIILQIN